MNPTVSVVVTCYNLGQFLPDALESVQRQTFADWEIVLVDDGSDDIATRQLVDRYESVPIRVIRTANQGLPAARNVGLSQARGRYFCALDADDILEPTWLEKAVEFLDRDSSVAFVSHWLKAFGAEEWTWRPARCDFPALLDVNTVNGAALVRREVLESVGGFDVAFREGCEDWDLWISLVERGYRGAIIPEVLFRYRRRSDSMSRLMQGDRQLELYERLIEKHAESFDRWLPELILRRDRDRATVKEQTHKLMREDELWLRPRLASLHDSVGRDEARVSELQRQQEQVRASEQVRVERDTLVAEVQRSAVEAASLAEERARLQGNVRSLREQVRFQEQTLSEEREKAVDLHHQHSRALLQIEELTSSWSWRLTKFLRWIHCHLVGGGQ